MSRRMKWLLSGVVVSCLTGVTAQAAEKRIKPQSGVEGEAPPALPVEGATRAPVIDVPEAQLEEAVSKFHLFGYGELHSNTRIGSGQNEIDFHRMVLGVGYDFTDRILLRSEVDFEHAFKEPELEFAYVDFLLNPSINVRVGSILVPMGVINQHHEPPLFYSVERPEFYRVIIPTSWQEGGAGLHGKLSAGFEYELYGLSSLDATGFTGSNGLRGGRGHVGEQPARDYGVAGRLQYKGLPGFRTGTSFFLGNTGQGNAAIDGGLLAIVEADAKYAFEGIELDGAVGLTTLTDAGNINNVLVATDATFSNFVARQMLGWYVEAAYHLFHHLLPDTRHDLVAFSRFEDFNTQHKMPTGFAANAANDRNTLTTGISYLPIPQVALKADYMVNWNQANGGVDQFNLGLGFYY